jgi:hypothetical protein
MVELRGCGDMVVVYTDEQEIANKLFRRESLVKSIPYEQEQDNKTVIVGFDFYFPKAQSEKLLKSVTLK